MLHHLQNASTWGFGGGGVWGSPPRDVKDRLSLWLVFVLSNSQLALSHFAALLCRMKHTDP